MKFDSTTEKIVWCMIISILLIALMISPYENYRGFKEGLEVGKRNGIQIGINDATDCINLCPKNDDFTHCYNLCKEKSWPK